MEKSFSHVGNMVARRVQKSAEKWASAYWHGSPLGTSPKADKAAFLSLWAKAKNEDFPEIDMVEKEAGFAIDKQWLDELGLHTQVVIKTSPICYQHGRVLYSALREYLARSGEEVINIVETGTARAFSSIVMAKALSDAGNHGRIITFDLLPHDRKIYWNCIDDLEGMKSRRELIAPWAPYVDKHIYFLEGDSRIQMSRFKMGRINFAFLDGAHTLKDVMAELSLVAPLQKGGDMIVFDDYSPTIFPGLVEAVDEGCRLYKYSMNVIRSKGDRAYVIARKRG
jgi:predicted O-methyltransferase YrrM